GRHRSRNFARARSEEAHPAASRRSPEERAGCAPIRALGLHGAAGSALKPAPQGPRPHPRGDPAGATRTMTSDHHARRRAATTNLALTALVLGSGVTDVTTFLTLENVFTSAMTGNMALLGIALSGGRWTAAAHAFAALVGFTCGAVSGSLLYAATDPRRPGTLEAIRPLLWVEIV